MGVEFNEPSTQRRSNPNRKASFLSNLIIKMGLAKTAQGAQLGMLAIAVLALVCTYVLLPVATKEPKPPLQSEVLLK